MGSLQVRRTARGLIRALVLLYSLLDVLARFAFLRMKNRNALTLEQRAAWLHFACKTIVQRLSMPVVTFGVLPTGGLVVSNHLSYLDILFYASVMPCIFVSKSDVLQWPLFGILARCGGTIFVERTRVHGVNAPAQMIAEALKLEIPVILFPEGTSTDGSNVLPFRSALFEPAIAAKAPITPAAVGYSLRAGVEADLCYYGDTHFFPHLLSAMEREEIQAKIVFPEESQIYSDRKMAAGLLWKDVVSLRESLVGLRATVTKT
jgi:lyso-ornithine lipid O-acyltransferase